MIYFLITISLIIIILNYLTYVIHVKNYGSVADRDTYTMSWPTRIHKYLKDLFYIAVIAHVFVQPLIIGSNIPHWAFIVLAVVLGLSGIWLLTISLKHLGNNFNPCYSGILPEKRVKEGPYKYLRHPIYVSNVMQFASLLLLIPGPILYIVFIGMLWIYYFTIRDENRSLDAHFSEKNIAGKNNGDEHATETGVTESK